MRLFRIKAYCVILYVRIRTYNFYIEHYLISLYLWLYFKLSSMYKIIRSLIYSFIRVFLNVSLSFSYRNIIVTGYEKVKKRKPVLFVSNHQNTFMDGLVLVKVAKNINPNILVRADIFQSKWAAIALDIIRLIPIYRKKDKVGSVAQNSEIFKKCIDLFKEGKPILIFPEGNHDIKRFLRPIKKGAARLAFQAEEENDFNLQLTAAPFGLEYENHPQRWYDLHVHFAEPFLIDDYGELYNKNPLEAQSQFTNRIREEISAEMVDIKWKEEYEFMEDIRQLIKPYAVDWAKNKKSIVHAETEVVNHIAGQLKEDESKTNSLKEKLSAYFRDVQKAGLSYDYNIKKIGLFQSIIKSIGVVIGAPFWLLAKLINFIPEYIIERKVIDNVKDITWHISLRAGISIFLYPIFYLIIFLILGFSIDWLIAGIAVFSLPLISVVMYETEYHFKRLKSAFILSKNKSINQQESELVDEFKKLALD